MVREVARQQQISFTTIDGVRARFAACSSVGLEYFRDVGSGSTEENESTTGFRSGAGVRLRRAAHRIGVHRTGRGAAQPPCHPDQEHPDRTYTLLVVLDICRPLAVRS